MNTKKSIKDVLKQKKAKVVKEHSVRLQKEKQELIQLIQVHIDEIDKSLEPTVALLKDCSTLKNEKLTLSAFRKLGSSDHEKLKQFFQKVSGVTHEERLYLQGVLRRNVSYFNGTLFDELEALRHSEAYQACLKLVRKWLEKIENDDVLLSYEGNCLYKLGHYEDAIIDFNRAIQIDAGISVWWVFRGDCYSKLEQYDQAIRDYTVSLTLDAENWAVYDKCARALFLSGQTDKAIEYEEYAVKKGGAAEATLVLIQMFKDTGESARARAVAKKGLKQFPKDQRFQKFIDEL